MELIALYVTMLKDPTIPGNRVVRKVAVLAVAGIALLVYYRHLHLGFSSGEAALVTLGLCFMLVVVVGIFGGVAVGAFYTSFLERVGAQNTQMSAPVFFAEWLFAIAAPLVGLGVMSIAGREPW
jgi:hypothetical protein